MFMVTNGWVGGTINSHAERQGVDFLTPSGRGPCTNGLPLTWYVRGGCTENAAEGGGGRRMRSLGRLHPKGALKKIHPRGLPCRPA